MFTVFTYMFIFQVIVDQIGIWCKIYQVFVFLALNSWDLIVDSPLSSRYIFLCKLVARVCY